MKVLICGASGYGNIGDDLSRDIIASYLSDIDCNITMTRPPSLEEEISKCDKIIFSPSGGFYDDGGTDQENFENYLSYLKLAVKHNKPFIAVSAGIQSPLLEKNLEELCFYLDYSKFTSFRHKQDVDLLQPKCKSKIYHIPDIGLDCQKANYSFVLQSDREKIIIIPHLEWSDKTTGTIIEYINEGDFDWYLCSTNPVAEQNIICHKIYHSIKDSRKQFQFWPVIADFYLFPSMVSNVDHVITGRYHGAIFGAKYKKTLSCISTDQQSYKFLKDFPINTILQDKLNVDDLNNRIAAPNINDKELLNYQKTTIQNFIASKIN